MPKRWLSRRGRTPNSDLPSADLPGRNKRPDFDFAFSTSPSLGQTSGDTFTALPRRSASNDRPTTAGGLVEGRSRKKLKLDLNAARPRTSEGRTSIIGPSILPVKSHEDLIGVAYGSPSHPPMAFYSMNGRMSPGSPNPVFRSASPFPEHSQTLQPTKWKKIGAMFKARHGLKHGKDLPSLNSSPAISQKQGFNTSNEHLPKHHWFKPRQNVPERPHRAPPLIPAEDDAETEVCERSRSEDSGHGKTMLLDSTPTPSPGLVDEAEKPIGGEPKVLSHRPTRLSSLPKLETHIPNRKDNQDDVVSRSLAARESSNLLARRSRTLESLKSGSSSRDSSTEDRQSNSKKRMSTPTMPKLPFKHAAASSPSSAKYSLFPSAAATPVKIVGRIPAPEVSIRRSFSSPGRLSPMSDTFSKNKFGVPQAKKTGMSSEQAVTSPEANTASTDHNSPWSTNHSVKSSVSSATTVEEIFFDIKSVRDSKGLEDGQHFVMARPDSTVVQLARTRSKLNAASRTQKHDGAEDRLSMKPKIPIRLTDYVDRHASVNTVNSAVFDAAIAEVEKLTSPSNTNLAATAPQPQGKSVPQVAVASRHRDTKTVSADISKKLLPPDPVLPMRTTSKGRRENNAPNTPLGLPSPIIEESSPMSINLPLLQIPPAQQSRQEGTDQTTRKAVEASAAVAKAREKAALATAKAEANHASEAQPLKSEEADRSKATGPRIPEDIGLTRVALIQRVDTPCEDSPTIPQSPPPRQPKPVPVITTTVAQPKSEPPPVPKKDSKFIPISRFAAKNTISKVENLNIRPARPTRAATDILPASAYRGKATQRTERSATIPAPKRSPGLTPEHIRPSPHTTKSDFASHTQQTSPSSGKGQITAIATVIRPKPAAEVSVARTISLSRKQSARVLVPGPKLVAKRAEDEKNRVKGLGIESTTTSAAGTPTLSNVGSPQLDSGKSTPRTAGPLNSNPSIVVGGGEMDVDRGKQEKVDREVIERFREQDKRQWELVEKRSLSPVVVEGHRGHKVGVSMNLVFENI